MRRKASSASAPPRSSRSGSATTWPRSSGSSGRSRPRGCSTPERKQPLPRFPRAVGIVTGADAAARGDLVTGIRTRFPPARIVVAETRVQGPGAAAAIVASLRAVACHADVDVIVVTRGGGSFEDLLPFSDERVVRAFAACPVPIVSAVGHEQDTPLCDLAADARASTPTAAARLVVPDLVDLERGLERLRTNLTVLARRSIVRERERLVRHHDRLRAAPLLMLERRRAALDNAAVRLQALSPRSTLDRGYAIVRASGTALRNAADTTIGEWLEIELSVGGVERDRRRGARHERRRADLRDPP